MRKIGLLFLAVLFTAGLFSGVALAALPANTVSWQGETVTVDKDEIADGTEIVVSASLYTSGEYDKFNACNLKLTFDTSVLALSNSKITAVEGGYSLIPHIKEYGYNVIVANIPLDAPDTVGYNCTINFTVKVVDAEALIEAGSASIQLGLYENDLTLIKDDVSYSNQDNAAGKGKIEINPVFTPMIIKVANTHTISYEVNGGADVSPSQVEEGTTIDLPTSIKEGHTLEGWYTDAELTEKAADPYKPTADTTLYAKWVKNDVIYTVTFEANGGEAITPAKVNAGNSLLLPPSTREGFTLEGWYTDTALTQKAGDIFTPTADTTFYAKWIKSKDGTYTITYEANGGAVVKSSGFPADKATKLPTTTRAGYTFEGWYTDAALTYRAVDPYTPTADTTLYAKWTKISETTYTMQFDTNGGSAIADASVIGGNLVVLPTPTKSGYTFAGWYTDAALKNKVNDTVFTPTADTTLFAKWTANASNSSVPSTGRDNIVPILIGILGALVLCAGLIVFIQRQKMNRKK